MIIPANTHMDGHRQEVRSPGSSSFTQNYTHQDIAHCHSLASSLHTTAFVFFIRVGSSE